MSGLSRKIEQIESISLSLSLSHLPISIYQERDREFYFKKLAHVIVELTSLESAGQAGSWKFRELMLLSPVLNLQAGNSGRV